MPTGRYKFRATEVKRALGAFGRATGLEPTDLVVTIGPDGTISVHAKAAEPAMGARDASTVAMERIAKLKAGATAGG